MKKKLKKKVFYTEWCYPLGLIFLALATAMMTRADFGLSMIVAPSYVLHRWLSAYLPFFSFGMASYVFQALLLLLMMAIVRRFRLSYLFSFVTAVLYGFLLDGAQWLIGSEPLESMVWRIVWFTVGLLICTLGVALIFHTYLSPEVFELFVAELCDKFGFPLGRCKTVFDLACCALGILLSLLLFHRLEGISVGTVICAVLNGFLISCFSALMKKLFVFKDRFPKGRLFFQSSEKASGAKSEPKA